jgi:Arm DNA-binding domain
MLTDTEVRNLQPKTKQYKVADGGGMYLDVRPTGAKYWRLKYRIGGKEKLLALGVYPAIGIKEARKC